MYFMPLIIMYISSNTRIANRGQSNMHELVPQMKHLLSSQNHGIKDQTMAHQPPCCVYLTVLEKASSSSLLRKERFVLYSSSRWTFSSMFIVCILILQSREQKEKKKFYINPLRVSIGNYITFTFYSH